MAICSSNIILRRAPRRARGQSKWSAGPTTGVSVSVLVELAQMPHYHEQLMLDTLASKMRREYGEPPVRPKRNPAPVESPDAGSDEGT